MCVSLSLSLSVSLSLSLPPSPSISLSLPPSPSISLSISLCLSLFFSLFFSLSLSLSLPLPLSLSLSLPPSPSLSLSLSLALSLSLSLCLALFLCDAFAGKVVVGADGANSRVAKDIEAGDYEYAIAFQERMRIPDAKMDYYKDRAEMYVGDDVSPDFYAWVFPKCDHVAVGTGTVVDKKGIQRYQQGIRDRAAVRIEGGEIIRVEAHPIPEHPRPWRVKDRAILVGDAAGYVTKCSGEGIYFAAKSGRMCAETIVKNSQQGVRMIDEADLMEHIREWDSKYGPTYLVLDLLQKVFYTSDAARESFVELCEEEYVQKVTFDSYLYKTVQGNDPMGDLKLGWKTLSSLYKFNSQELLTRCGASRQITPERAPHRNASPDPLSNNT